eukprot:COSAG06_NODE_17496_length_938_cov_0.898689_2_plen_97_part_00
MQEQLAGGVGGEDGTRRFRQRGVPDRLEARLSPIKPTVGKKKKKKKKKKKGVQYQHPPPPKKRKRGRETGLEILTEDTCQRERGMNTIMSRARLDS